MSFLTGFATGAAKGLTEDIDEKKKRRRELVDAYAIKLQEKVLSAQTKRSATKNAYKKAFEYAKVNGVPYSVVNDSISRNGDISKLMEEVTSAADRYRLAAQDANYRKTRFGTDAEMSTLFPDNNPDDDPDTLAATNTPNFAEGEVGETGNAFSHSGTQAFNKAIMDVAKATGKRPEEIAGIVAGAYEATPVGKSGAPAYTDKEMSVMGGDGDKNQSFTKFYKVDPKGGTVDLSSQITVNNRELQAGRFDELRDQGYAPESIISTMVQQGKLTLIEGAAREALKSGLPATNSPQGQLGQSGSPQDNPGLTYAWKTPEAKSFWMKNYEKYKGKAGFTPEKVEQWTQALKAKEAQ